MTQLVTLTKRADSEKLNGQKKIIVEKLEEMKADRRAIPISQLVESINARSLRLRGRAGKEKRIKSQVRQMRREKLLRTTKEAA